MRVESEVPAPVGVTATSVTDGLLVQWTPASGTPPGTTYEVGLASEASPRTVTGTRVVFRHITPGAGYRASVSAVMGDHRSTPTLSAEVTMRHSVNRRSIPWVVSVGLCVFAAATAIAFGLLCLPSSSRAIFGSLAMACAVISIALTIMTVLGGRRNGLLGVLVGADGRVSTSYLQTALWTALVGFVVVYFTGLTWFDDRAGLFEAVALSSSSDSRAPLETSSAWDDYLILLGGPFAALVTARGIVGAKVANQTVQKTVVGDGSASLLQALKDDGGRPSLVDNQYLVFNLAAFVYVIVGVATVNRLPAIPPLLLALTSSAAAGYVLGKAVESNPPAVTGLTPSTVRIGGSIVVEGQNLRPGNSAPPTVSIGGRLADISSDSTTSRLTVTVPVGLDAGPHELLVTTGANVTTQGRWVQVLADKPLVLGVEPVVPNAGEDFKIHTLGIIPGQEMVAEVSLLIDGSPTSTQAMKLGSGGEMVTVPKSALRPGGGTVSIVVRTARLSETDPITITLARAG